jgi:hypothetical protein
MSVTIYDALLVDGSLPIVDAGSQGTIFDGTGGDFTTVLDGLVFETGLPDTDQTLVLGSEVDIGGVTYTLTNIWNYWGYATLTNPTTGDVTIVQGQTNSLILESAGGDQIQLVVPNDSMTTALNGWTGDPISSLQVFTVPIESDELEGETASKIGEDDEVHSCFTAGTLIDTKDGRVKVEDLRAGDLVLTRDNGYLPLTWVGGKSVNARDLANNAELAPVRIAAGALGVDLPDRDMLVSPQHRMLISGPRAELMFGEHEVLVPAIHMVGLPGITREEKAVTYMHIMFDHHEIVRADGAWTESFQPGEHTIAGLEAGQRAELLSLFPELGREDGRQAYVAARMSLKHHEARALLVA